MRKVRSAKTFKTKSVTIFREDLEAINGIAEEANASSILFKFKDTEYDNIDEIKNSTEDVHSLHIQIQNPYISVRFSELDTQIYAANENLVAQGAFNSIVDLIKTRSSRLKRISTILATFIAFPLTIIMLFLGVLLLKNNDTGYALLAVIFSVITSVWYYISYLHDLRRNSRIVFENKSSSPSFLVRNKDEIIVGLIVAVPSFIFGLLIS